jgi:hypothetical protein
LGEYNVFKTFQAFLVRIFQDEQRVNNLLAQFHHPYSSLSFKMAVAQLLQSPPHTAAYHLFVWEPNGQLAHVETLVPQAYYLGRLAKHIVVQDPDVSRCHCRLTMNIDAVVTVCDLGSRNGTFVKGIKLTPVSEERRVAVGDEIKIGDTTMVLMEM